MSTTTDLSVAATFTASKVEGKIGVVYEMQMGMIDRYMPLLYIIKGIIALPVVLIGGQIFPL